MKYGCSSSDLKKKNPYEYVYYELIIRMCELAKIVWCDFERECDHEDL